MDFYLLKVHSTLIVLCRMRFDITASTGVTVVVKSRSEQKYKRKLTCIIWSAEPLA